MDVRETARETALHTAIRDAMEKHRDALRKAQMDLVEAAYDAGQASRQMDLRELRESKGWSRGRAAAAIGCYDGTLSQCENGTLLTGYYKPKLAAGYDVSRAVIDAACEETDRRAKAGKYQEDDPPRTKSLRALREETNWSIEDVGMLCGTDYMKSIERGIVSALNIMTRKRLARLYFPGDSGGEAKIDEALAESIQEGGE